MLWYLSYSAAPTTPSHAQCCRETELDGTGLLQQSVTMFREYSSSSTHAAARSASLAGVADASAALGAVVVEVDEDSG